MSVLTLSDASAFGTVSHDSLVVSLNLDGTAAGPTTPETARALRHLLGLRLPDDRDEPFAWNQFDEVARDYLARVTAADPTGRQRELFLTCLSAYVHELRHAHDLLSTTIGQDVLFKLVNCYQNVPLLLLELASWQRHHPRAAIPIPLADHFSQMSGLGKSAIDVVRYYKEALETVRELFADPNAQSYTSIPILLETSAVNTQLAFIHEVFGAMTAFEVTHVIARGARSRFYLSTLNRVRDVFVARKRLGDLGPVVNYLVHCALMGAAPLTGKLSDSLHPATLFEALVDFVCGRCREYTLENVQVAVNEFCNDWRLRGPTDMALYCDGVLVRRAQGIDASAAAQQGSVVLSYKALTEAYRHIHRVIRDNPSLYFSGQTYSWTVARGLLPAVFLRVRCHDERYDFVGRGSATLSPEEWIDLDGSSMLARMLIEGFGSTGDVVLENELLSGLTNNPGWQFDPNVPPHRFRFRDVALFPLGRLPPS